MISPEQKSAILTLARQAVRAALSGEKLAPPPDIDPILREPRGCFVTLHNTSGQLRGCIGTFIADRPLADCLIEMGGAVTRDPRFVFDRVTLEELDRLVIEVSVLTPMQPMDDPLALEIGADGIYVKDPASQVSGCFLPQVATDQGWDAAQMVSYCCSQKMGLAHDAWKPPTDLQFFRFQAEVFSETAPGRVN